MLASAVGNVPHRPLLQTGFVKSNQIICEDHLRLIIELAEFPHAEPGEFVHIGPDRTIQCLQIRKDPDDQLHGEVQGRKPVEDWSAGPLLRRAYSLAAMEPHGTGRGADIELIYRVVGAGTRWMSGLTSGDAISVLGPLGNRFPIRKNKKYAWLVAGGVGLPPMLWLGEFLSRAGRDTVAFCGAQKKSVLALTVKDPRAVDTSAQSASLAATEFTCQGVPVVLSTDDGSIGFQGYVGSAVQAYHAAHPVDPAQLVVYTCGPEPMMRHVAEYCVRHAIECHVCMERSMACGLGTCQSCVVPVTDPRDADGWTYRLCCTEGPVFDAQGVVWDSPVRADGAVRK